MRFMMVMAAAVTGLLSTTLAAEDLARKYGVHPKGATLLELAKVDIEISRREFVERLSKMGAKVVGPVESGQIIEWDNRDGGTFVDWFIDICILDAPKCDTTDGPSTLLEMSLVK